MGLPRLTSMSDMIDTIGFAGRPSPGRITAQVPAGVS